MGIKCIAMKYLVNILEIFVFYPLLAITGLFLLAVFLAPLFKNSSDDELLEKYSKED